MIRESANHDSCGRCKKQHERNKFSISLREMREKSEISIADLAKKAGINRDAIYKLERGDSEPTWDTVQRLADALGISTDKFREKGSKLIQKKEGE